MVFSVTELGLQKFPWWLDWRDRAVAIIASGPSVKKEEVASLRDRLPVLAIKENYDLAGWADVVYGCDTSWWRNRQGLTTYSGLKISAAQELRFQFKDIKIVELEKYDDSIRLETPGLIGAGGNSGFQALNIAAQFGATRILLLGFDMDHRVRHPHWYGRNQGPGRTNPDHINYDRWRKAFTQSSCILRDAGIEVINGSPVSLLRCFPQQTVKETLERWEL